MRGEDYELLYQLEETFWWFVGMRRITDTVAAADLRKPDLWILDAGCGTGYNLAHYASADSRQVYGLDLVDVAVEGVRRRGFSKIAQASVTEIPFKPETFDLVFSFDVLQQLPVDVNQTAIREMHRVLKPGGLLFVRVAAFEWLRSSHDEDIESFHRFTRGELDKKLVQAGFAIERISYANCLLFPVVVVTRLLKRFGIGGGTDVKPLPRGLGWVDPVFRSLLGVEARWLQSGRTLPIGLSIICCARKETH